MNNSVSQWLSAIRGEDLGYLARQPYLALGIAVLVLLLLWLAFRLRPRRRIRAFTGDTGPVEISKHALLDLVRAACEQLPEVRKPAIRIRARRHLNLSVRIHVDGSARLRDTASFLQNHIKDALENNLGVERLGRIEVLVTGLRSASAGKFDLNPRGGSAGPTTTEQNEPPPESPPKTESAPKAAPPPTPHTTPTPPASTPVPRTDEPPKPAGKSTEGSMKPPSNRPDLNPALRKEKESSDKNPSTGTSVPPSKKP